MKKYLFTLGIVITLSFLVGGEFQKRKIFPYGTGIRGEIYSFFNFNFFDSNSPHKANDACNSKNDVHHNFSMFANRQIEKIFIGDSIVQSSFNKDLFEFDYTVIGVSGMTIDCLKYSKKYLKKINPKEIIIYLGGNDSDLQGVENNDQIKNTFKNFIEEVLNDIELEKIFIIGIYYGSENHRNYDFAYELNANLRDIAKLSNIVHFIEPYNEFNFQNKKINKNLSYDGEHLTYEGYRKFFDYINSSIKMN